MFVDAPTAPETQPAVAALVGGHALVQLPPPAGLGATGKSSDLPEPEKVRGMVKNQDFIVYSLVLAGLLLVGAVIFMFFDRWRKRPTGESARDTAYSLNNFRQMYEDGELTEAEYEKIKLKMAAKMKEKLGVTTPPTTPPAAPPTPPPEPPPPDLPSAS